MANTLVTQQTPFSGIVLAQWNLVQGDTVGLPFYGAMYPDKTVQMTGTFGPATVIMEGDNSLDGSPDDYVPLRDIQGNAISMTSPDAVTIEQNMSRIRPSISGADGTTDITIRVLARSAH